MNNRILDIGILAGLLIVCASCRDEYSPNIDTYNHHLVVDGLLTNAPGPYTVKLSTSSSVDDPAYIPFSNCNVVIQSQDGESEQLQETESGIYQTSPDGIQGHVGKSYRLSVITAQGERYQTPFIEMPPPVGIDTVTAELEYSQLPDYVNLIGGYQFYISTKATPHESYFLWKFDETYEFHSQYKIRMIYRGMGLEPFYNRDTLYTCWKTQSVPSIFTATTAGLSNQQLIHEPIHYVNSTTKRLQVRYSLLVKQYSIPSEAYYHWKAVQEQVEGDDFLITNQPYQITGNLEHVNNPEKVTLGYFTVGSVQKKRFFFESPDVAFHYSTCTANSDLMALYYMPSSEYPIYLTSTLEGIAFASDYCFDCTLWNGSLEKPEFWIDKKEKNTDTYLHEH